MYIKNKYAEEGEVMDGWRNERMVKIFKSHPHLFEATNWTKAQAEDLDPEFLYADGERGVFIDENNRVYRYWHDEIRDVEV